MPSHDSMRAHRVDGYSPSKKKRNRAKMIIASSVVAVALAGGVTAGTVAVVQHMRGTEFEDVDRGGVVEKRDFNHKLGQQHLPEAKTIKGVGRGVFTARDPKTGEVVHAPIVGIDTTGDPNNAVLAPPEALDQVGWYVRSAPFGVDKGSTVLTSHIDYNGIPGLGTLFPSLKKGDPITLTDSHGKEHHYVVSQENTPIDKKDPDYIKKTSQTINKDKGKNILVLVSCYGEYVGGALGYKDNSIVVATPVKDGRKIEDFSSR